MKKLVAILLCLSCVAGLSACSGNSATSNSSIEEQSTTSAAVECKYFDVDTEQFTNDTLITLNLSNEYESTSQELLLHQNPIYQIGDFKNNEYTITVFQYNKPDFDLKSLNSLNDNWYLDMTEDTTKIFYTKKNDIIIGVSISKVDVLPLDEAIEIFNSVLSESVVYTEVEPVSDYADATIDKPAKLGEWISLRYYNEVSKTYEPILVSITKIYNDDKNASSSMITKYNSVGQKIKSDDSNIGFVTISAPQSENISNVIYEYSIYYPTSYTSNNGIVENPVLNISLCNENDTSTTINGNFDIFRTVHDFNDVYRNTATVGQDYTSGMGTYNMYNDYYKYLIKIDTPDGPRYYSVQ